MDVNDERKEIAVPGFCNREQNNRIFTMLPNDANQYIRQNDAHNPRQSLTLQKEL
jgi:hypothetical protein